MTLKKCSRCTVYSMKGQRLGEARVTHFGHTVTLFFSDARLRDPKIKAKINFYDDVLGVLQTNCTLKVERNTVAGASEPLMADCKITDVTNVIQRQKDVRVKVEIETPFFSNKRGSFMGVIDNISAGGIYLITKQTLEPNEIISFEYRFKSLVRHFDIMAIRAKQESGGRYGYGCRFINLTDGADAAIRSYVYKKQLETRMDKSET